jgi:hypothetical protein
VFSVTWSLNPTDGKLTVISIVISCTECVSQSNRRLIIDVAEFRQMTHRCNKGEGNNYCVLTYWTLIYLCITVSVLIIEFVQRVKLAVSKTARKSRQSCRKLCSNCDAPGVRWVLLPSRNTSGVSVKTYIVGRQITSEIKIECMYGASWNHSRLKEYSLAKILSIHM